MKAKQKGAILVVVLSIMILLSFMIISLVKLIVTNNELNNAKYNRDYAFILAETALNIAEEEAVNLITDPKNNIIPVLSQKEQEKHPVIYEELLEGGPKLNINNEEFKQSFTNNCLNGLCAPTVKILDPKNNSYKQYGDDDGIPAWFRNNVFTSNDSNSINNLNSIEITTDKLKHKSAYNPRYIIEFLGSFPYPNKRILLRITVKAWGEDKNISVMLQSYIEI